MRSTHAHTPTHEYPQHMNTLQHMNTQHHFTDRAHIITGANAHHILLENTPTPRHDGRKRVAVGVAVCASGTNEVVLEVGRISMVDNHIPNMRDTTTHMCIQHQHVPLHSQQHIHVCSQQHVHQYTQHHIHQYTQIPRYMPP